MSRDAAILGIALGNASERELASMHAALRAGLATGAKYPGPVNGKRRKITKSVSSGHPPT